MTAADPNESSYACYYDNKRHTYLGDVFSVNWMEIAEEVVILFIYLLTFFFFKFNCTLLYVHIYLPVNKNIFFRCIKLILLCLEHIQLS